MKAVRHTHEFERGNNLPTVASVELKMKSNGRCESRPISDHPRICFLCSSRSHVSTSKIQRSANGAPSLIPKQVNRVLQISKLVLEYAYPIDLVACLQCKVSTLRARYEGIFSPDCEVEAGRVNKLWAKKAHERIEAMHPLERTRDVVCVVPNRCNFPPSSDETLDVRHAQAWCPCIPQPYQIDRDLDSNHDTQCFLLQIINRHRIENTKLFATKVVCIAKGLSILVSFDDHKNPSLS